MPALSKLFSEFTPGAYGIWLIFGLVSVALVKAWPVLALQAIEARDRIRGEGRSDLSDCRQRLDAMSIRLDNAEERHHQLEMKLLGAITAYRLVEAEVEKIKPDSMALAQARIVMSAAFTLSPSTPPTGPGETE